jgi:cytochrome c-type biogenesis protein CcmH/NrfG
MVWTAAFAAVTIVGTIYGAGLKTRIEYKQEKEKFVEAPVEERVAALEQRRAQLMMHRGQVEKKLVELRRKMVDEPQGRDVGEAGSGK